LVRTDKQRRNPGKKSWEITGGGKRRKKGKKYTTLQSGSQQKSGGNWNQRVQEK